MKRSSIFFGWLAVLALGCTPALVDQATNAYSKGDIDRAEVLTERALSFDPTDLHARRLASKIAAKRGADAFRQDDFANARMYFEQAVAFDSTNENAHQYLKLLEKEERRARERSHPPRRPRSRGHY